MLSVELNFNLYHLYVTLTSPENHITCCTWFSQVLFALRETQLNFFVWIKLIYNFSSANQNNFFFTWKSNK